jgi:hypothetical protein
MMMDKATQKSEGPSCICGSVDLYEESLKQKEKSQTEASDTSAPDKADNDNSSVDS